MATRTKLFRINLDGTKQMQRDAEAASKAFAQMVAQIKAAKADMASLVNAGGDQAVINSLVKKIDDLERAQARLNEQKVIARQRVLSQEEAEKKLAEARLKNAQADKAEAQTEEIRTRSMIQQEKELERLIALEEKRNKIPAAIASPGTFNAIKAEYDALRKATINNVQLFDGKNFTVEANEAIAKLRELKFQMDEFSRSTTRDGLLVAEYTSGIVQAFQKMGIDDIIRNQINGGKQELEGLKQKTNELIVAYRQAQEAGTANLGSLEKELAANVQQTQNLTRSIAQTEAQLNGIGGIGGQITASLKESFANLKNEVAQVAIGYFGFQTLFSGAQKAISINFDFEDSLNQLKALTGLGSRELELLRQKALETGDTTKFSANETIQAFKLIGSAKPELLQDAEALNRVKDAAVLLAEASGSDLPSAVESLTQVLNQFDASANESTQFVDALAAGAKFGAAEIPNITAAILEFGTQAKSSNISVQESIALIELLAEKGIQGAEAGTKLRNVLLAMNAVEGLSAPALQSLAEAGVNIDILSNAALPAEQRLTELGKVANNNAALVKIFGKENFNAAQIVLQGVPRYAQLAGQIQSTGVAQQQAADQTNSASTAWKRFYNQAANFVTSKSVTFTLTLMAEALSLILSLIYPLTGIVALYGIGWLAAAKQIEIAGVATTTTNGALILQRLQLIANNILLGAQRLVLVGTTIAQTGYNLAIALFTRNTALARVAMLAFNAAMNANPLAIVLTILGLLVGAFTAFAKVTAQGSQSLREYSQRLQAMTEINRKANEAIATQINTLDAWMAVIRSSSSSVDTKRAALEKLIEVDNRFDKALQGNTINLGLLKKAYDQVTESIRLQAQVQASASLSAEKQKEVLKQAAVRQTVEMAFANNTSKDGVTLLRGVSDEIVDALNFNEIIQKTTLRATNGVIGFVSSDIEKIKAILKKKEDEALKAYQQYLSVQTELQGKLTAQEQQAQEETKKRLEEKGQTDKLNSVELQKLIDGLNEDIKILREGDPKIKELQRLRDEYQKRLDAINNKQIKTPVYGGAKLTGVQKDEFKDIDAERDRMKALLEKAKIEQSKFNGSLISNESIYLKELLRINNEAIDKKLALIKSRNAEERKIVSELNLEKIKNVQETNEKLFAIENSTIERRLLNENRYSKTTLDIAEEDPALSNVKKLSLKETYFNQLLSSQVAFNSKQVALEKQYSIVSVENEQKRKDAIEALLVQLRVIRRSTGEAEIQDIRSAARKQITEYTINYSKLRQNILANDRLTSKEKKRQLDALDQAEQRTILSAELAALNIEVRAKQLLLAKGLISGEEYLKAVEAQNKKAEELAKSKGTKKQLDTYDPSVGGFVDAISNLFKTGDLDKAEIGKSGVSIGAVISESYSLAKAAMNDYYDAQRQRIQESMQMQLDQADREKARLLARAQNKAEEETIERQFDQKKRQIERAAGERLKKQKKAEAKIAFVAELANIAVQAAANPANSVTFGLAGITQFALLSTFAGARLALNLSQINREQFEKGGSVKRRNNAEQVTRTGGIFSGPRHAQGGIPFQFEGEDEEAFIINRRSMKMLDKPMTMKGTARQILSTINEMGGGVSFSGRAKVSKFENGGVIGSRVQAPVFSTTNTTNYATSNSGAADDRLERMEQIVSSLASSIAATDNKPVFLNHTKVTEAQKNRARDVQIGTI